MHVHVFVFEHRHGRDVSAFASEELALADAARIARKWWGEARKRDPLLPAKPPSSDAEAVELYFAAQEGVEFHEIACCAVQGLGVAAEGHEAPGDPYVLRREVERVIGEDRVPAEELERLLATHGGGEPEIEARRLSR